MKSTRHLIHLSLGLLALSAATSAAGQEPAKVDDLERARSVFRAADSDGNGALSVREAAGARIRTQDFAAQDADADRSLSEDEFLVYYRQLLVNAGRTPGKDLENEASRVLAARKAADDARRKAEQDRLRKEQLDAARKDAQSAERKETLDAARKETQSAERKEAQSAERKEAQSAERKEAQSAERKEAQSAERKEALDQQRAEALREETRAAEVIERLKQARAVDEARERDLRLALLGAAEGSPQPSLQEVRSAFERTRTGLGELTRNGQLSAEEARSLDALYRRRAAALAGVVGDGDTPEPDVQPLQLTPYQRAHRYAQTLVNQGRLSAPEARTLFQGLTAEDAAEPDAATLRAALARAEAGLAEYVGKGRLTQDEADRFLAHFEGRARAAAEGDGPAPAPAPEPAVSAGETPEQRRARQARELEAERQRVEAARKAEQEAQAARAKAEQDARRKDAAGKDAAGKDAAGKDAGQKDPSAGKDPAAGRSTPDGSGPAPAPKPASGPADGRRKPEARPAQDPKARPADRPQGTPAERPPARPDGGRGNG